MRTLRHVLKPIADLVGVPETSKPVIRGPEPGHGEHPCAGIEPPQAWEELGWGPCITERAAIGSDADADVALPIHADAGPETGRGFHVICPASVPGLTDDIATESERLALALHRSYGDGTGMPITDYVTVDGLSRRDGLSGLNLSDVSKVSVETGNMRNGADAALLSDPDFRDRAAAALATGIAAFLVDPVGSPERSEM